MSRPIDDATIFTPPTEIVSRQVGDEVVLVDLDGEQYFSLNHTGAVAWNQLTSGASFGAAVDAVVDTFDVEPALARTDLTDLLNQLLDAGLIESQ